MSGSGFAKAEIDRLDKQNKVCERIPVMFNPKELVFSKQNNWGPGKNAKTNVPDYEFNGGGAATLKIQLFFDTYADRVDVREKYTDKICKLAEIDPRLQDSTTKKGRPPTVRFQWGNTVSFDGVITSIGQRFTLFLPDNGKPVRALLDISLSQVKDKDEHPSQNPTSGGQGGERIWIVKEGDTLAWIAFTALGNAGDWRRIADANRLNDVRRLRPGTRLSIPNE